jgi:putative thioredoxin
MSEPINPLVVPSLVVAATDADFTNFVELSKQVPVIVDLWATWCEPCKQ